MSEANSLFIIKHLAVSSSTQLPTRCGQLLNHFIQEISNSFQVSKILDYAIGYLDWLVWTIQKELNHPVEGCRPSQPGSTPAVQVLEEPTLSISELSWKRVMLKVSVTGKRAAINEWGSCKKSLASLSTVANQSEHNVCVCNYLGNDDTTCIWNAIPTPNIAPFFIGLFLSAKIQIPTQFISHKHCKTLCLVLVLFASASSTHGYRVC